MVAQPPRFNVFEERSSPRCRESWGAAPQDATRSGELQLPREIKVFNSGSCKSLLFQIVPHGYICFDLSHTTPTLETWISVRGSPSDPSASQEAAPPGPIASWGLRSHTLGLRPQNPALGGCALKSLQWLRYLIEMLHLLNCNQVAKPLQSFGGAASKCSALGATR